MYLNSLTLLRVKLCDARWQKSFATHEIMAYTPNQIAPHHSISFKVGNILCEYHNSTGIRSKITLFDVNCFVTGTCDSGINPYTCREREKDIKWHDLQIIANSMWHVSKAWIFSFLLLFCNSSIFLLMIIMSSYRNE